ncbi:hypothetical protein MSPP1_002759 [Malassezia sp. CBS 17886]|nr:hypothetical protein MSPP1_002759 [Malassezia sp. CBS 17886]
MRRTNGARRPPAALSLDGPELIDCERGAGSLSPPGTVHSARAATFAPDRTRLGNASVAAFHASYSDLPSLGTLRSPTHPEFYAGDASHSASARRGSSTAGYMPAAPPLYDVHSVGLPANPMRFQPGHESAEMLRARSVDTADPQAQMLPPRPFSSSDMRAEADGPLDAALFAQSDPNSPVFLQQQRHGGAIPLRPHGLPAPPHTLLMRAPDAGARRGTAAAAAPRTALSAAATSAHAAADQRTQLFVGNLPYSARWQDVKDLFRRAGTVLRADVHVTAENRSCGTGTVLFATEDDALHAVETLHGYSWQGRVLDVQIERDAVPVAEAHRAEDTPSPAPSAPSPHLPPLADVPPPADAPLALPSLLAGHPDFPSFSGIAQHGDFAAWSAAYVPGGAPATLPYPGRVLFIGNLPFHCQWQDLKDLFRAAGNIQRADVALNADGRSRGFGTVLFASPEDAQNAVRLYHGYEYSGRALKVHFDRLAHAGPLGAPIPSDPSQYTAAFSAAVPAAASSGLSADTSAERMEHTAGDAAPGAGRATASHPGRISLPQPPPAAGTESALPTPLGVSMTPGVPNFFFRPMLETPPPYPHMLSPGLSFPTPPAMVTGAFNPYMNATPGASLGFSTPRGNAPFGFTYPHMDMAHHAFPPGGPGLPPTPHWSQPAGTRPRTGAVAPTGATPHAAHAAVGHESAPDTPLAHAKPADAAPIAPVGTRAKPDAGAGYPFPILDPPSGEDGAAQGDTGAAPSGSPWEPTPAFASDTRQLTEAIAKLSVRGGVRSARHRDHASSERNAAECALSRMRENLSSRDPDPPGDDHTLSDPPPRASSRGA